MSATIYLTPMKKHLDEALNEKFIGPTKFAQEIERIVYENAEVNYIDAIVIYCEKNSIELESVSKLISKPLKEKLKCNATELNFLKRSSRAKLPL